jgi:DNA polymerase-1
MEIKTEEQLAELKTRLLAADKFAFDCETTDLHHKLMEIVGVSFMVSGETSYINYKHFDKFTLSRFMKDVFSTDSMKIGHNLQFDLKVMKYFYGIEAPNKFDTMIAAWYLDENRPKGLKFLGPNLLQIEMIDYKTAAKGTEEDFSKYAEIDALVTYKLYELFEPLLVEQKLDKLFRKLEMPFIDVLIDMTLAGINVDVNFLKEMETYLALESERLKGEIKFVLGDININSSQQLCEKIYGFKYSRKGGQVVFEGMTPEKQKAVVEWTKPESIFGPPGNEKTPVPSFNESAVTLLSKKRKELTPLLQYRETEKALTTYAKGYQRFVIDGVIYPSFNQSGTVTGRLSSSDPNMQNIPANTKAKYFIKDAFYAPEGCDLIVADESQLELRILAHYSQDAELLNAFQNGIDIHTKTASAIYKKKIEEISKEERRAAKTLNFAILYGMGYKQLAKALNVGIQQAKAFLSNYFEAYKGTKPYMSKVVIDMMRYGYIETLIGRRRRVPEILSYNPTEVQHAERQIVNSQIQGTASDVLKVAMLKIHNAFKEKGLDAKILLQIHDELVIRSKKEDTEEAVKIVKHYMEKPFNKELSVPLVVEPIVCHTWGEAKRDG